MISITKRLELDLEFLKTAKTQNFQNVSCERIEELVKNKIEYKKNLSKNTLKERELYSIFKFELHSLCSFKLPFRMVEVVKKCIKNNEPFPPSLLKNGGNVNKFSCKEEKKEFLNRFLKDQLEKGLCHQDAFKVVESIHWIHGTNSAILPMLQYNDYTMLCTGELLNKGIGPMCGELNLGGMAPDGVNQKWISVETIRDLYRSWSYAAGISNSFKASKFENGEQFFEETINKLQKISPDDSMWDSHVISLLQLKQWDPKTFEILIKKYCKNIDQLIFSAVSKTFVKEGEVLAAFQYPEDLLQKVINDAQARKDVESRWPDLKDFNGWHKKKRPYSNPFISIVDIKYHDYHFVKCRKWLDLIESVIQIRLYGNEYLQELRIKSDGGDNDDWANIQNFCEKEPTVLNILESIKEKIEKRIQSKQGLSANKILRLKNIFRKDLNVKISELGKAMITSPFPILVASTKSKCFFLNGTSEANIPFAKWGEEVDLVFVKLTDVLKMTNWLETNNLIDKIKVLSVSLLCSIFAFPLIHSSNDAIGENAVLSSKNYSFINQHIKTLLSKYQIKEYEHHGIAHATRAAYFTAIITEMYTAQGYKLDTPPQYLPITGFLHDSGRGSDFGEDLWDADSAKNCEDFMSNQLNLPLEEVEILSKSILEKDCKHAISLEQKIIHDADCIEINRCFKNNLELFDWERLWMFKDQFSKPLLELFIHEAKSLILLTEKTIIKKFLQNSSDSFQCLFQIIEFSKGFPFLKANTRKVTSEFISLSNYMLTPEMEVVISNHLF